MKFKKLISAFVALAFVFSSSISAFAASGSGTVPVLLNLTVGSAAVEVGQTSAVADFAFKVDNPADNGVYPTGDGNTITITNSDGYTFDWQSDWPVTVVLVKAGSNFFNAFFYPAGSFGDTGLYAPINPANDKPFSISHVTFGYNEPPVTSFTKETAWAAGSRYVSRGNWAMFVNFDGQAKTVDLIAGGGNPQSATVVGSATLSAPVNGLVTITINLTGGAKFHFDPDDPINENLKVQDYASAPNKNPAPGRFDWKASFASNATSGTITVPANNFYGIHLDVDVPVAAN